MVNFDKAPCIYWSLKQKTNWLERYLIIHCILYYELDNGIISDKEFDYCGKQLLQFKKQLGPEFKNTEYYYVFKDWDNSTGFYVWDRLTKFDKVYLKRIANQVLMSYKEKNKNVNKNASKQGKRK